MGYKSSEFQQWTSSVFLPIIRFRSKFRRTISKTTKMNTATFVLALAAFVASGNAGNLGLVRTVGITAPVVPVATAPIAYSQVYSHTVPVLKTHTFAAPAVYTAPAVVRAPTLLAAPTVVKAPTFFTAPIAPVVAAPVAAATPVLL